jgi:hypothetical protein
MASGITMVPVNTSELRDYAIKFAGPAEYLRQAGETWSNVFRSRRSAVAAQGLESSRGTSGY